MTVEQLFPERRRVPLDSIYADLGFSARAEGLTRPYVAANMISSTDGRASLGGRTKELSSSADRELFQALREQVDAVMVGPATIGIERYGPLVRDEERRRRRKSRGLAPVPLAVTASRSLELPVDTPLFGDPQSRIVVLSNREGAVSDTRAEVIVETVPGTDEKTIDLVAGLEGIRERYGVRTLLFEGGPTLLAAMLGTGAVDELFLTHSPYLVDGSEPSLLEGPSLPEPLRLRLLSLLKDEEDFMFGRYAVRKA